MMPILSVLASRSSRLSMRLFCQHAPASSLTSTDLALMKSLTGPTERNINPFANSCGKFSNFNAPTLFNSASSDVGAVALVAYWEGVAMSNPGILQGIRSSLSSLLDLSTWLIKRTFQPSIIRKRRKHGFLRRKESVGGRRVLKRRAAKGRMRLGGS